MKRTLAWAITGTVAGIQILAIGATVRGPYAKGVGRDLAAGLGVVGIVMAVAWADREIRQPVPLTCDATGRA